MHGYSVDKDYRAKLYKINTGTSYAAPMVMGVIALLMEEFPILKETPDLGLTALLTGARMVPGQSALFEGTCGAGLIDYKATKEILKIQ